jgi:hypothetical protein
MSETQPIERVVVHHSGPGTGMILGIVVAILAIGVLAFVFIGQPGRGAGTPSQNIQNQTQPSAPISAPAIEIPRQIDVNINAPAQQQVPVQVPPVGVQLP